MVLVSPDLRLPSFTIQSLNPHDWNNIPLPMVAAMDTLKEAFINVERLYIQIIKEHKSKGDNIAKKFKDV